MNWIWNKKRYSPFIFLGSISIKCLNMAILVFILDMFLRVNAAKTAIWNDDSGVLMMGADSSQEFFATRGEQIFQFLFGVVLILAAFCGVVIWLFQKQQAAGLKRETAMFLVSGYSVGKVRGMLMLDGIIDLMIALLFTAGIIPFAVGAVIKSEMFEFFYKVTMDTNNTTILAMLLVTIFFILIMCIQSALWLKKEKSNGLSVMLKSKV